MHLILQIDVVSWTHVQHIQRLIRRVLINDQIMVMRVPHFPTLKLNILTSTLLGKENTELAPSLLII